MTDIIERSGSIESDDPLASFLYELMRDHVPPGIIEELVQKERLRCRQVVRFSNGWLAQYSIYLAEQLRK
jgi:hypothetical protein